MRIYLPLGLGAGAWASVRACGIIRGAKLRMLRFSSALEQGPKSAPIIIGDPNPLEGAEGTPTAMSHAERAVLSGRAACARSDRARARSAPRM